MAKITDPDNLNQSVEVEFITGSKLIKLNPAGNLEPYDGVTMQALYSFTKEEWLNDDNLIKFPFPFISITAEQFELFNGWDLSGSFESLLDPSSSKNMIRDAGWAVKDAAGNSREEYMNITSLGAFNDSTADQAYYLQSGSLGYPPTSSVYTGEVNIPVRIYASGAAYGAADVIDFRNFFNIYLREQGKVFGSYDLITEQNITTLTYKKFALPLVNSEDLKVTSSDTGFTGLPYSGMSINYYTSSQNQDIGGTNYPYKILIDGNSGTAEQIYEWTQFQLRQTSSIDSNDNYTIIRGDTAGDLLAFIGDTLRTQLVTIGGAPHGVYIQNFLAADTNRLEFTDDSGSVRTFPFVAAGTILFNENLQNDPSARYFMFFTNDDSGDNTGRDFGTKDAIIINDNAGPLPITGSVATSASVAFDYDYDGNIQRGSDSSGSDAPFTAVALGLSTAQYVVTTGTITRSTVNSVNFVAALERNYAT
jgi:hypothetical protein